MARGKKLSPEEVYQIMATWAVTNSFKETSRILGFAVSTIKSIVDNNKDKEEFVKLRNEKRADFSEKADRIINMAMDRLEGDIGNKKKDIPVNQLTTVIGTLYDKKALADGKPTERTEFVGGEELSKLAELAGYERKR